MFILEILMVLLTFLVCECVCKMLCIFLYFGVKWKENEKEYVGKQLKAGLIIDG